jgi:hypothetical protein
MSAEKDRRPADANCERSGFMRRRAFPHLDLPSSDKYVLNRDLHFALTTAFEAQIEERGDSPGLGCSFP